MLKELRIRNLAIIDDLIIRFGPGLNVLTGETGAGKSIIVDALGLALGERGQSDLIRSGEKEASVQAYFEPDDSHPLPDIDIDVSEGLLLRRVLSASGKSRAYVNDTMVTTQTLAEIGASLVDVLSQHEHQSLLKPDQQRVLLDSYGRLRNDRERYSGLFEEVRALKAEQEGLRERVRERAHRLDLLRFQVEEIGGAALEAGEKERLEEERKLLANASKLHELSGTAYALLYESEGACTEQLSRALGLLRELAAIDPAAAEILKVLESAQPLVDEAAHSLRDRRDHYDLDPGRLEEVEDRLDLLRRLGKKYGDSVEAMVRYRDEAAAEMELLASTDERLGEIERTLVEKEAELMKSAEALSARRKKTAQQLQKLVGETLKDLAFGSAVFGIDVRREQVEGGGPRIGPHGIDRIEFMFSANSGEPPRPLSKIVSGGELSRVMLGLKTILADVDDVPVLIFDEVDAGVGGKTAEAVGRKLSLLAERRQLLCITHLPQIASCGSTHLRIEKTQRERRVAVDVTELAGTARRDEIARMLSGTVTDISLKHAGELLERVK